MEVSCAIPYINPFHLIPFYGSKLCYPLHQPLTHHPTLQKQVLTSTTSTPYTPSHSIMVSCDIPYINPFHLILFYGGNLCHPLHQPAPSHPILQRYAVTSPTSPPSISSHSTKVICYIPYIYSIHLIPFHRCKLWHTLHLPLSFVPHSMEVSCGIPYINPLHIIPLYRGKLWHPLHQPLTPHPIL